jgi:hypothetical protein
VAFGGFLIDGFPQLLEKAFAKTLRLFHSYNRSGLGF